MPKDSALINKHPLPLRLKDMGSNCVSVPKLRSIFSADMIVPLQRIVVCFNLKAKKLYHSMSVEDLLGKKTMACSVTKYMFNRKHQGRTSCERIFCCYIDKTYK